jgi:hypothetical protein
MEYFLRIAGYACTCLLQSLTPRVIGGIVLLVVPLRGESLWLAVFDLIQTQAKLSVPDTVPEYHQHMVLCAHGCVRCAVDVVVWLMVVELVVWMRSRARLVARVQRQEYAQAGGQ